MEDSGWRLLLPRTKGQLPNGATVPRTDPSGASEAAVMFLGAYPAATATRRTIVEGVVVTLPVAIEEESFARDSKSGKEIDENYLRPLGLQRGEVLITDMVPYYLANTTRGASGRSMADNIRLFEKSTGFNTGIDARPTPSELVRLANEMPGNHGRLREYATRCSPRLLFTLGTEAAAFVRQETFGTVEGRVEQLFYAPPERLDVFGVRVDVVHLVHPHLFIKRNVKWMRRHRDWAERRGRDLVVGTGR